MKSLKQSEGSSQKSADSSLRRRLAGTSSSAEKIRSVNTAIGNQAVAHVLRGRKREPIAGASFPAEARTENHPPPFPVSVAAITDRFGSAKPLPTDLERELTSDFGHDFSGVQVQDDEQADYVSKSLGADALAVGNRIVLSRDRCSPGTSVGRQLIRHEAAHIAAGQTTGPSPVQLKVSLDDVSEEMIGRQFSPRSNQGSAPDLIPQGSRVIVKDWKKREATAIVEFNDTAKARTITLEVPKLALDPAHPTAKGVRRYEVGLPAERTAVESGETSVTEQRQAVADWKKKEASYKKNHKVWAASLNTLETELVRREDEFAKKQGVLSDMLLRETMLNRFDPEIVKWVDHYNKLLTPVTDLDPNIVKSMLFRESRMGTSGENLELPPYSWSDSKQHPIRSRFNIGQAVDSSGPQQLLMIREMAPSIFSSFKLDELEAETKKKGKTEAEFWAWRGGDFARAVAEFHKKDPGTGKNLMGTPGKELFEDYAFWIRTAIRWLFYKYASLATPDWGEAVRAYNGIGERAKKYKKDVMKRVGGSGALDVGIG